MQHLECLNGNEYVTLLMNNGMGLLQSMVNVTSSSTNNSNVTQINRLLVMSVSGIDKTFLEVGIDVKALTQQPNKRLTMDIMFE